MRLTGPNLHPLRLTDLPWNPLHRVFALPAPSKERPDVPVSSHCSVVLLPETGQCCREWSTRAATVTARRELREVVTTFCLLRLSQTIWLELIRKVIFKQENQTR